MRKKTNYIMKPRKEKHFWTLNGGKISKLRTLHCWVKNSKFGLTLVGTKNGSLAGIK